MVESLIKVALIGFPELDRKRLDAAFKYSKERNVSYEGCELEGAPDILMVNADEPNGLILWRSYREEKGKTPESKAPPSLLAHKKRDSFDTEHYQIRRPLIASRVIGLLDQIVDKELQPQEEEFEVFVEAAQDFINVAEVSPTGIISLEQQEELEQREQTAALRGAGSRVLVVDDSLPVRIQMEQALSQFDTEVDFAESGEEALSWIHNNEYDLIFLDVVLPGVDGYEICKIIKEGKAEKTPVIMLTSNSSSEDKIKGKLAGCDTYLIKPVGKIIFQEMVGRYLYQTPKANAV